MPTDEIIETMARAIDPSAFANTDPSDQWAEQWLTYRNKAITDVRAALSAAEAAGMVMVPRKPTEAMLDAVTPSATEWIGHPEARPESVERWRLATRKTAGNYYRAMIAAAGRPT